MTKKSKINIPIITSISSLLLAVFIAIINYLYIDNKFLVIILIIDTLYLTIMSFMILKCKQ